MSNRNKYEKENTGSNIQLLKLYLAIVGFVVGSLTVYQSMTGTDAPVVAGVVVAGASALAIAWLLRAAS